MVPSRQRTFPVTNRRLRRTSIAALAGRWKPPCPSQDSAGPIRPVKRHPGHFQAVRRPRAQSKAPQNVKSGPFRPLEASGSYHKSYGPRLPAKHSPGHIQAARSPRAPPFRTQASSKTLPGVHSGRDCPRAHPNRPGQAVEGEPPTVTHSGRGPKPISDPSQPRTPSRDPFRSRDQPVSNYSAPKSEPSVVAHPNHEPRSKPTLTHAGPTGPTNRHLAQPGREQSTDPAMVPAKTIQAVVLDSPKGTGMSTNLPLMYMYPMGPNVTDRPHRY